MDLSSTRMVVVAVLRLRECVRTEPTAIEIRNAFTSADTNSAANVKLDGPVMVSSAERTVIWTVGQITV